VTGKLALPVIFNKKENTRFVLFKVLMTKNSQIDRQREHQANERTFLAWLRTSIALIGFGFAIARFSLFLRQLHATLTQQDSQVHFIFNSENLGVGLVVFGIVVIALAAWRYNQVFWQIEQGNYRPNRIMVFIITSIVMILGTLSIPLVLWANKLPNPTTNSTQRRQRSLDDF
jgi:putative membrane protein